MTEGAGKKLAASTYTENSQVVLDQKVIEGEHYLASYQVSSVATGASGISTATGSSHLIQIMAGSSLNVRIRRIEITQGAMATAVSLLSLGLYRLSSAGTGGTVLPFEPLDPADVAAGASAMALPTVKGTLTVPLYFGPLYMMQTLGVSNPLLSPGLTMDFDRPRMKPLLIPAGTSNGIILINFTAVAAGTVAVNVWMDETSY